MTTSLDRQALWCQKNILTIQYQQTLPKLNNYQILKYIQAQGHNGTPIPLPLEEEIGAKPKLNIKTRYDMLKKIHVFYNRYTYLYR